VQAPCSVLRVSSVIVVAESKTPYDFGCGGWKLVLLWPTASTAACGPCRVAHFLPPLPVLNFGCGAALPTNDFDHAA
jgi:hypothetical protein